MTLSDTIPVEDTTYTDARQTELRIIKGVQEIFHADAAMIVERDEEAQHLVIKKPYTAGIGWAEQTVQQLEPGALHTAIEQRRVIVLPDVNDAASLNAASFDASIDGLPGVSCRSYLCSPLTTRERCVGALALLNPRPELLSDDRIELFQILATALSNAIYNARMFMQLRVSNADLEASRFELLNSRNTLRTLIDNLPTSIYIIDGAYKIVAINRSRADREGEPPSKFVGRRCYEKLYHRSDPCPDCRALETLQTGQLTSRLSRGLLKSGEQVEWEINTFPIQNNASDILQVILTESDVTEKRRMEADLLQSEKLASIGQLATGVAHEIYNPLTAIIANAQMVRRALPVVNDDTFESLEMIEHAGIRASQVIRTLLSAARSEEHENSPVDLNMSIENVLSLLSHEIQKRPVTVTKYLQENLPPIYANTNDLQGVWINLLMYTLDALDPNGGAIQISSRFENNLFCVTIHDNGRGIPKSKLDRIFEPYFTTKSHGQGTGLGLSMCLRVVKQHGGKINVESHLDQGTKFIVTLPNNAETRHKLQELPA